MARRRLQQLHVVPLHQASKPIRIRRPRRRLVERSATLRKEHLEPRPREQQQQARRLIPHNHVLVRHVLRRVEKVPRMRDHLLGAAGQLDRSLQNVERFRLAVVHVQRSTDSRRVRDLNHAERSVRRAGSGNDPDPASRPPPQCLSFTRSHDDGSGTGRCLQLAHGHDELPPFCS